MSEFNWDAFNGVLQNSTAINSTFKGVIERAIRAGRVATTLPVVKAGQIWRNESSLYLVAFTRKGAHGPSTYSLVNLNGQTRWADESILASLDDIAREIDGDLDWKFEASSLKEYVAKGGKL